jgi:diaminopimelate epimerase
MATLPFTKMHGLGNDFVVIDARAHPVDLTADLVRALSDRHRGIGFDQIMVIKGSDKADAGLHMANADGATVGACGNGTRCVAALLLKEFQQDTITLDTDSGLVSASAATNGLTTVDMGPARTAWLEIPVARVADTLHLDLTHETAAGQLSDPVGVNMGNPHAVFFVDDIARYDLGSFGREIEHHALFPERANISLAQVEGDSINLVVWERGVGLTLACGTAACAALVAAARRDLCGRSARVHLPGGALQITWREDNHVLMTGPVATSFSGAVDLDHLMATAS